MSDREALTAHVEEMDERNLRSTARGTTFADGPISACPSCGSDLGPFVGSPDGRPQVLCSTCGMRGPYETMVRTAEEGWNRLTAPDPDTGG